MVEDLTPKGGDRTPTADLRTLVPTWSPELGRATRLPPRRGRPVPIPAPSRATGLPTCYRSAKVCDGSCGQLLPGGLCTEVFLLSARNR